MQVAGAHFHVVGAAGVGMSAVAELLVARGARVTGSDRFLDRGERLPVLETLERAGVRLALQDGSSIHPSTAGVVVSTAIEPDNPERLRAEALQCPVIHRADLLARLAEGQRLVAVAGTAGKTTVTALIGWILEQAGWDPTVVNGGVLRDWERDDRVGNARVGGSSWWVLEADESDRSLLRFRPEVALITNVSQDHFSVAQVRALFRCFASQVRSEVWVGQEAGPVFDGISVHQCEGRVGFAAGVRSIMFRGRRISSPLVGRHNAENVLAAVNVCSAVGVSIDAIAAAVGSFGGVRRRLEVIGRVGGVTVVDDYAHNPVKITAAWGAARELGDRVLAVWRPHGFRPLALMRDDLIEFIGEVMEAGDRLHLLPVFYAGGTAGGDADSDDLGRALRAAGLDVANVDDYAALERSLTREMRDGDVVLVMGARDPGLPRFCRRLLQTGGKR